MGIPSRLSIPLRDDKGGYDVKTTSWFGQVSIINSGLDNVFHATQYPVSRAYCQYLVLNFSCTVAGIKN